MKGNLYLCLATLVLASAAPASAQTQPGKFPGVTLDVKLIGGDQYEGLYTRIAAWEKLTGAKVNILTKKSHFELNKEIKQDMAAGNIKWCVASNHTSFLPVFKGLYTDMSKLVPASTVGEYDASIINAGKLDGKLVMLPRAQFDVSAIYYRKSLYNNAANKAAFKAKYGYALTPPTTFQQYKDQAMFFTKAPNMYGTQFPGKDEAIVGRFYETLRAYGGQMFDKAGKPTFDSPAGEKALQFFVDLYKAKAVPSGVLSYVWDDLGNGFASGGVAIDWDWPGFAGFYNDPKSSKIVGDVGVAPPVKGPTGIPTGWSGAHGFSITEACANKPAAASLVLFLTNYDSQLQEALKGPQATRPAVRAEVIKRLTAQKNTYQIGVINNWAIAAKGAFPVPSVAYWDESVSKIYPELQAAILGQKTVKQALGDAQSAVMEVMQDY